MTIEWVCLDSDNVMTIEWVLLLNLHMHVLKPPCYLLLMG